VLWAAQTVIESNAAYNVPTLLPGLFAFASNGAGELLAFDARAVAPFPVVMVPFVPMQEDHVIRVAASFEDLRAMLGILPRPPVVLPC
jgi:hypothetical protein